MGRQHGGPQPLRRAEPHFSMWRCNPPRAPSRSSGWRAGETHSLEAGSSPRKTPSSALQSCSTQAPARTSHAAAAGSLTSSRPPLEGPYLRSAYRVRVTPARQNPSKNLSVLNMVTFTDSATVSPKMRMKMMEKSSTGRRPNLQADGDTVSHRRPGRASPGASRRWAGTPRSLHPSCTLVGRPRGRGPRGRTPTPRPVNKGTQVNSRCVTDVRWEPVPVGRPTPEFMGVIQQNQQ